MRFGEALTLRDTNERVYLITRLNDKGDLLVGSPDRANFEVNEERVLPAGDAHPDCC